MKKLDKVKKLAVRTESVRDLSVDQMAQVGGGSLGVGICYMITYDIKCAKGGGQSN